MQTAAACGTSGAMCVMCPTGQTCTNGQCTASSTCDATSCAGGCCVGPLCLPYASQNVGACGTGGQTCQGCTGVATCTMGQCVSMGTCNGTTCPNGCCSGNLCVPYASQSAATCGTGGAVCGACPAGNACVSGVCGTGTACDFFSCAGCCTGGTCVGTGSQSATGCGLNGAACAACAAGATCTGGVCTGGTTCNATTCAGCCNGNTCVSATSDASCGHSGSACVSCGPGQACTAGTCVPTVTPACIVITPNDYDFGTVQTGCRSAAKGFTLRNVCPTTVTVNAVGVAGSTAFASGALPMLPATLAANATQSFTVTFTPAAVGTASATLVVGVTQAAMSAVYQTRLTGSGASSGANVETFTLPTKTDVVLVVDNSCSMSSAQMALGSNANAFLAYAFGAGVDFHLAVTTTDMTAMGARGAFVGPAPTRVLKSTTPNLLSEFNARVNVGINGSASELMFAPAAASVTAPLVTTTNAGFLRGDANLSVLALTDAAEQSGLTVDQWAEQLLAVKGWRQRNRFSYSIIGPTQPTAPAGCFYDGLGSDPRHRDMIARTGGVSTEICSLPNTMVWRPEAQRVGQAVFGGRATWFLTGVPSPATATGLAVSIGGVLVPELGVAGRNWSYDATRNAVVFEPGSLPAPGQTVSFAYSVACMP